MRRLPIYLLIDCSESMAGPPQQAVDNGLRQLLTEVRQDPMALETVWLSIIVFGRGAQQLAPLQDATVFQIPDLPVLPGTEMGAGLMRLAQSLKEEVKSSSPSRRGDWRPLVFLLTDGAPTDDVQPAVEHLRHHHSGLQLVAIGCGPDVDYSVLHRITPNVLRLADASATGFKSLFKWISASVNSASVEVDQLDQGAFFKKLPTGIELAKSPSEQTQVSPSQKILAVRCGKERRRGYLIKYKRTSRSSQAFDVVGAYPVSSDYFGEASAVEAGDAIDSRSLKGTATCPYCENKGWHHDGKSQQLLCGKAEARPVEVVFVLDVTQSMQTEIDGVKQGIEAFVNTLRGNEQELVSLGMVAFRDVGLNRYDREPQLPEVLRFNGRRQHKTPASSWSESNRSKPAVAVGMQKKAACTRFKPHVIFISTHPR